MPTPVAEVDVFALPDPPQLGFPTVYQNKVRSVDAFAFPTPPTLEFTTVFQNRIRSVGVNSLPYPANEPVIFYRMRAKVITSSTYIQWSVEGHPDATGVFSGYPPGSLTDIVIVSRYEAVPQ
jgi:hypothetical protein